MKIAIGSDHRGVKLKEVLKSFLESVGHTVDDLGPQSSDSVDYPVYAEKVGKSVSSGNSDKGIVICGSGIGASIASNKVKGIRAVLARSKKDAEMGVRHNNANVLCLGADETSDEDSEIIVKEFLKANFEGGRHKRRVDIMNRIEEKR
ncbi:MAG: ribose 5-phosphate isomerase B [Elusimicrobia bacterium]|nr:ribose 5-phosphate isomerase B [Elusimicrobiota bacterium]